MGKISSIQYATNLVPPVAWHTRQTIYDDNNKLVQITDPANSNSTRF